MKRFILTIALFLPVLVYAETPATDSVARQGTNKTEQLVQDKVKISETTEQRRDSVNTTQLDDLVVYGKNAFLIEDGAAFVPTLREKKSARDARDLLLRLGIPSINVDPLSLGVTSRSGKEVEFL